MSTLQYPQRECPGPPGAPSVQATLVAAVHAHRQAQRQVGHGFLRLPDQNGIPTMQSPARHSLGVCESARPWKENGPRRWARQVHVEKGRAGRRARGTGWACSRRLRRAMCAETCTVQPAARGSVRYGGALGMAGQRSRLDQPGCAPDGGCQGARGCLPRDPYVEPACERVTAWSCFALRRALH